MKKLLKRIEKAQNHTKQAAKQLAGLKAHVIRQIALVEKPPKQRDEGLLANIGSRLQVIARLIGILRMFGITTPVGPSDTYDGSQIGFNDGRMRAYVKECRVAFQRDITMQAPSISIGGLADVILKA